MRELRCPRSAAATMEAGEESLHRLSGTGPSGEAGGLVLRAGGAEQHVFKAPAPRVSLLGLDVLAAQKRRERQEEAAGGKRSRVASYKDWEEGRDEAGNAEEEEEDEANRSDRRARRNRWRLQGGSGCRRCRARPAGLGSTGWAQSVTGGAAGDCGAMWHRLLLELYRTSRRAAVA